MIEEPAPSELSTINFSGSDFSPRDLAEYADLVQVQEVGVGSGAVYEEAAVLYANGNVKEAEALLEAALQDEKAASVKGLWMMLLDLYELTGQRERFESRVLDYATRFERSPPPWRDLSAGASRPKTSSNPSLNLTGALTEKIAPQLAQLATIARKMGSIRVDLGRLRSCDEAGSRLLLGMVRKLTSERIKVILVNCTPLVEALSADIEGDDQQSRVKWMLLLELLQYTGEYERFEEMALNYAITFEESPPSWESKAPPPQQADDAQKEAVEEEAVAEDGCSLEGELTSANSESIRNLAAYAVDRKTVEVECINLRRIDFVSAGTLFNVMATLRAQGTKVTLRNVNAMVGALLRVMSVDQVAVVMLLD